MKMKKLLVLSILFISLGIMAQVPGYYNGVEGKTGTELKEALNEIIHNHIDFSYSDAKYILNYADSDPDNSNNVILFYTKRSQSNDSWGSGSNDINREHVWAKSHGDFSGVRPMDGDAFNLHPTDASVNIKKSNYDFDECSSNGTYISEADAYYTSTQFEPADEVKGEVARTIFYMAVRYEGEDGELDLKVVDKVNTYPAAEHGKLSALLQWNKDFPPTDLERRRNERVWQAQNNRNPFIDNPEFADLIWAGETISGIEIGNLELEEDYPLANSNTSLKTKISGNSTASLYIGTTWDSEDYSYTMSQSGDEWTGAFDLSSFSEGDMVYYKIEAIQGETKEILRGTYRIPIAKTLTEISEVQGTGNSTPLSNSVVTIGGRVCANFDNTYYIQNGSDPRNGIAIYDIRRGHLGDSIVVSGKVSEYNNLTELTDISYTYVYSNDNKTVEPVEITIDQANENYEGMLVKIRNVTFLDGDAMIPLSEQINLVFTDGSSSMNVYCRYNSRLSGNVLPSGAVDVTGIVSQYQDNYQLLVNSIDDITAGEDSEAPMLTGIVVNDANWIEASFNEKLEKTSAELISNFSINNDVVIGGAYLYNDTKVLLLVSGLQEMDYTLTVSGISDLQGNKIAETSMDFHSDYTGVNEEFFKKENLRVYPVPATDHITISFVAELKAEIIQLIGMDGRIIIEQDVMSSGRIEELDLNAVKNGSYILRIKAGNDYFRKMISVFK